MSRFQKDGRGNYQVFMQTPAKASNIQRFGQYLYNPDKGTVLDRDALNWAKLILFYIVFFGTVAALFLVCMRGLYYTLDLNVPKYILEQSLIGQNPGIGYRPRSNNTQEGAVIWYNATNETQINKWTFLLDEFLSDYNIIDENRQYCDFGLSPSCGKSCIVNTTSWGPCTALNKYSYSDLTPCIFVKINKVYGWMPKFYNSTQLPNEMPSDLKDYIINLPSTKHNQVWISCEGESAVDREIYSSDNIEYISGRGIPEYYFPYKNTRGYLSPLVVIRLKNLPLSRIINISCRPWAENINKGIEKLGFKIMID